jgi:hypothetical protein
MTLRNDREVANTRRKLSELEKLIERAKAHAAAGQLSELRSLTRLANQLREEIVRYVR